MKKHKITSFTKGWFIGDFAPTLLPTKEFETAMKVYTKGDKEEAHVHEIAREFTIIGTGKYRMNDEVLIAGDIMELMPGDVADCPLGCVAVDAGLLTRGPSFGAIAVSGQLTGDSILALLPNPMAALTGPAEAAAGRRL